MAPPVKRAVADLRSRGVPALHVAGDVGEQGAVDAAVATALDRFRRIDIVVNNAQALRAQVPFEEHTDADFDLAVRSGLWGTFRMMRAVFPSLRERGGRIINIASSAGTHGRPGLAAYAAAKKVFAV